MTPHKGMSTVKRFILWFFAVIGFSVFASTLFFTFGMKYFLSNTDGDRDYLGSNSILHIHVGSHQPSDMDHSGLSALLGSFIKQKNSLYDITSGIDRAASDPRIKALFMNINGSSLTISQAQEIRHSLKRFRMAGKQVIAYSNSFGDGRNGTSAYYLATSADEIWMQPRGMVSLVGMMAEGYFFRPLLDTYKVLPRLYHREEYKGLAESLTQKEFSKPVRDNMQSLLDNIHNQVVSDISQDLNIDLKTISSIVQNGPYIETEAKRLKLIRNFGYYHEVKKSMKEKISDKANFVSLRTYLRETKPIFQGAKRIAIINLDGALLGDSQHMGQKKVSAYKLANTLHKAIKDNKVAAIVLRINSPGGTVSAAESVWREVVLAAEKGKPLVASMGTYAASAGYMIAAPAAKIVATPATITGSIGVASGKVVFGDALENFGVHSDRIKSGENADFWSINKDFSEEQVKKLEGSLDFYYNDFLEKVSKGRRLDFEKVRKIAKGQVWTGAQAKEIGLVDELGDIHTAINFAKELANIPHDQDIFAGPYILEETNLSHEFQSFFDWNDKVQMLIELFIPDQAGIHAKLPRIVD
jgi:protease-4